MNKQDELRSPTSCLNKAQPEEPIFVLRAKDPFAAQTVRLWAAMAVNVHEPEKIAEAFDLAATMEHWRESAVPATAPATPNQVDRLRDREHRKFPF